MARESRSLILMLGPSLHYPGGMTEVVRSYAAAGVFAGWPVEYIPTYAGRTFVGKLRPWLTAVVKVLARLGQQRVAVLHVHSAAFGSFWRKSVLCALAAAFRVPYVLHLHDGRLPDFYGRACGPLARAWIRAVLRGAARVVVLTACWREVVQAIAPSSRVTVIGNPVVVPASHSPLRMPARTVLFLGWFQKEKGLFDLVSAIPMVLHAVPDAQFVIAGRGIAGGETPDSIRSFARTLQVEHVLQFPGWLKGEEKTHLLRNCDVFALPSYAEALPLAMLEAMAVGVPIVATRVGGIPDVIENRVNGLLVEPGQPYELARAVVELLTDDALRGRLREAALRDVRRRYRAEAVVAELANLYRELGVLT